MAVIERLGAPAAWLLAVAPGALIVALGFSAGGFFADTVALGAIALGLALVLRVALAPHPFAGLSAAYVAAAAALALFALWTLVSSAWSHAPARALLEYDRVLLYLLAFLLFGALGRTPRRLRWMTRSLAAGATAVCLCGLVTRVLPDVWSIAPSLAADRLSYPVTYWNALGLLAALGLVLCLGLTCDARESPAGRVLSAAALPVLAATLLLTFSRGGIVAVIAGVAVVVVVARSVGLISGLLVAIPVVSVAVRAAYDAELLARVEATTPAAIAQGHDLAIVIAVCALLAAVARAVLLALDARLGRVAQRLSGARPRAVGRIAAVCVPVIAVAACLALGAPAAIERQYDRFVADMTSAPDGGELRDRLSNPSNNGRIEHWKVALASWRRNPLHGDGAGTFGLSWDRDRPNAGQVEDAHSLYLEVLGELGVAGALLLGVVIVLVLVGFLRLARGPDRVVGAALLGAGIAWALRAGADWDWEMPAVTLWFFAAGGLALSAPVAVAEPEGSVDRSRMSRRVRFAVAVGCLILLLVPAAILRSQAPLEDSARAFARDDCPAAIDRALDSNAALGVRPEPWVIIGYCDVQLGQPRLGVRAMQRAVRLDPRNWEAHYGLAVARAAARLDPRPAARAARRLNPSPQDLAARAVLLFDTDDPRAWQRRAYRAPLPRQ